MKTIFFLLAVLTATLATAQTEAQIDSLENRYIRATRISDSPEGLGRVVAFDKLTLDATSKQIRVEVHVFQFQNDTLIPNTRRITNPYADALEANNGSVVDSLGNDIPKFVTVNDTAYAPNPNTFATEYQFFIMNADRTINIFDLILQNMAIADAKDRYND